MHRLIFSKGNFRIVEHEDDIISMEDLKGDSFKPEVNPEIAPYTLVIQEKEFEKEVNNEGVFGYELQKWNPEVNTGWEHVDSCFGFIGMYNELSDDYNHYIVEELEGQIK